jgi:hypothetical protein
MTGLVRAAIILGVVAAAGAGVAVAVAASQKPNSTPSGGNVNVTLAVPTGILAGVLGAQSVLVPKGSSLTITTPSGGIIVEVDSQGGAKLFSAPAVVQGVGSYTVAAAQATGSLTVLWYPDSTNTGNAVTTILTITSS